MNDLKVTKYFPHFWCGPTNLCSTLEWELSVSRRKFQVFCLKAENSLVVVGFFVCLFGLFKESLLFSNCFLVITLLIIWSWTFIVRHFYVEAPCFHQCCSWQIFVRSKPSSQFPGLDAISGVTSLRRSSERQEAFWRYQLAGFSLLIAAVCIKR